ncbi:uncharacterized protein LOC134706043 [Mytilus trossulus]|uniref:uncharacterized protein LOC134706043 n=1 Tax=Mytilus trossulus TaxID=6551 RepID=UPI0030043927
MGSIIDFLGKLKMDESMQKLAAVMKTVKKLIDNKPCFNPSQATDDELEEELLERGQQTGGSREQMINRLMTNGNQCPLLSALIPSNVYCTFDSMCMGVECCINVKILIFLRTVKVFARLDPEEMDFHFGIDVFKKSISFGSDSLYDGIKQNMDTNIVLPIAGGLKIMLRVEIKLIETVFTVTAGIEFCRVDDESSCIVNFDFMKDARIPLPSRDANGNLVWPKIDFKEVFNTTRMKEDFSDEAKTVLKEVLKDVTDELIQILGLEQILGNLTTTEPCPRPNTMTNTQIGNELKTRGLNESSTKEENIQRLILDDRTCNLNGKTWMLPEITSAILKKHVYYSVSSDCQRIDACVDFSVQVLGQFITKAFKAYVEIDFCNFLLGYGFEGLKKSTILINYNWGQMERGKIVKNDDKKVFVVDFGMKLCIDGGCIFEDTMFIKDFEIPIPICNENFKWPGGNTISDMINAIGGHLTKEAFNIILRKLGIESIFTEKCDFAVTEKECSNTFTIVDSMKGLAQCEVTDNCLGMDCCLGLKFKLPFQGDDVTYSIPFGFKLNPCDFEIEINLASYYHKTVLLNYDWGVENKLQIGKDDPAPITIRYKVDKLEEGNGFIIDLRIDICIPMDDEIYCFPERGFPVLNQHEIPACSRNFTGIIPDFSVKDWLNEVNIDINQGLQDVAVKFILDQLDLTDFFSGPKCDVERAPYKPSVQGWNNLCPLSIFNRPTLGDQIACHITESCTEIDCCANIPFFGLTVRPFFVLDPCDYKISYGINTENVTKSLFDYEWGKTERISLAQDLIVFEFSVKKPPNFKKFILDLSIKVCLGDDSNCVPNKKIFDNTEIPQLICDMDAEIDLKDFSLEDWANNLGINITGQMKPSYIKLLLQQVGLDVLLKSPPCSHGDDLYYPSSNGWKNDCPTVSALQVLPESLVCYLPDFCTGIDCCYYYDYLDLHLNINLYIDTCNYQIRGRIETLQFEITFFDYTWGDIKEERLQEIFRIRFKINKLSDQKKFIIDLDFSVCLEKNLCFPTLTVFKDQLIPQPLCDLEMEFKSKNASLFDWMKIKGLQNGQSLTSSLANELMEYFGLNPFLNAVPCKRNERPYKDALNGWNTTACPLAMSLPKIQSTISCTLPDYCTGVRCCVEVGKIKKSYTVYAEIDGCNMKLSFGIEKRHFEISLLNYQWGTEETFSLLNVIKLRFSVHDLQGEQKYLVNMKLSVCLESSGACLMSTSILENIKLPKLACNWLDMGFKIPDFSLTKFKTDNSVIGNVKGLMLMKLMEELGISTYLHEEQCSRNLPPYISSTNGWTNNCSFASMPSLPPLSGPATCQLMDTCTGIQCCIDVEQLSRSFSAYLNLEACSYSLEIGIEDLSYKKSLLDFDFDQKQRFSLLNVIQIDYSIDDMKSQDVFLINLDMSVCFESQSSCEFTISIFKNVFLPKPLCNWQDSSFSAGFSWKNWTKSLEFNSESVSDYAIDLLFEKLGIAKFLSESKCNREVSPYSPSTDGWNTTCDRLIDLQTLTGPLTCHIPDICTGVECCIDVDPMRRSFHMFIFIDACSNRLRIGIEKYEINISLFDYEFGIVEQFKLSSMFIIDYSIVNIGDDDVFLMNMNISICLEPDACLIQQILLQDVYLPKTFCKWTSTLSEFSVSSFLSNKGLTVNDNLNDIVITQIMNRLGISDNLQTPQCHVSAKNWHNECPHAVALPSLSGKISCTLLKSCSAVDCCLNVAFLKRNFHIKMDIDSCSREILFTVEKLRFEYSSLNFHWGVKDRLKLGEAVYLDFSLDNMAEEKKFRFSLNISIQFDPGVAMFHWIVLKNTHLPKLPCNWNTDFDVEGFSLQNWLEKASIPPGQQLSKLVVYKLFEELGIGRLVNGESCQRSSSKYSPALDGWKKECPLDVSLTPMTSPISCLIPSHCTAVDCCIDVDFLDKSFHTFLDVNTCTNIMTVGIEKLVTDPISLLSYEYGKLQQFNLKGMLRIIFKIDDLDEVRKLRINLNISICLESNGPCLYDILLFKDTLVPKPLCDWEANSYFTQNFSLNNFLTDEGLNMNGLLPEDIVQKLMGQLGLSSYLNSDSCSLEYEPNKDGWIKACFEEGVTLPTLPVNTRCKLLQSCLGVECCLDVEFLQQRFKALFELDACNHQLHLQIDRYQKTLNLSDYKYGNIQKLYLMNVVRMEYIIDDLATEKKYQFSLNISLCFETYQDCLTTVQVFKNTKLPKVFCDWGTGFPQEFSLSTVLKETAETITDVLPSGIVDIVFTRLRLRQFLLSPSCPQKLPPYFKENSWINNCSLTTENVPNLPSDVSCFVPDSCSAVECCLGVPVINETIRIAVSLDPCLYEMEISIEGLNVKKSLLSYPWGDEESFSLQGGIKLKYKIFDLVTERVYMIDLTFQLCLEYSHPSDCILNQHILRKQKFQKPLCSWDRGFHIPEFSLNQWLVDAKYDNKQTLDAFVVTQLMEEMGLRTYIKDPQCDSNTDPYVPLKRNRWNIKCEGINEELPSLQSGLSCHMTNSCTAIDCCLDVEKLGLALNFYFMLDTCNNKFTFGIENLKRTVSIISMGFGTVETFSFLGLLKIDYQFYEFLSERTYVANINMSLCFESSGCFLQQIILKDAKLTKPLCDYDEGFLIKDFSLTNWLQHHDLEIGRNLPGFAVDLLFHQLGISGYLQDPKCAKSIYCTNIQGWNTSECSADISVPTLPVYASCRLPSYCTGLQCCVEVSLLQTTFETHVFLDACAYKLSIGIENLVINESLFDYTLNTWKTISLGNLFRLKFRIEEITVEKIYLFDAKISVCFETYGDCIYNFDILDSVRIPKQPCSWSNRFVIPDFQIDSWMSNNGLSSSLKVLPSVLASQLMEDLDIASYLLNPSCDQSADKYKFTNNHGWNSDCASDMSLSDLPDSVLCYLDDTCTGLSCCANVEFINRNINIFLTIDPCNYRLNIGIEKYQYEFFLMDFEFGVQKQFHIGKVIELSYKITDFKGLSLYYIDLDFQVCFNDGGPCTLEATIFSNAKIPKIHCGLTKGFLNANWSLSEWYSDMQINPLEKLSTNEILVLMDTLGLASFLREKQCSRHDPNSVFAAQYQGWSTDCKSTSISLPILDTSVVTCYLADDCNSVKCCLDMEFIDRSLYFFVNFEPCNYMIKFGIERLEMNILLDSYKWGEWEKMDLYGVLKIRYLVDDFFAEQQYAISMIISVCWESNGECQEFIILDKNRVPKSVCNWNKGFKISDFSISKYMLDNGLTWLNQMAVSEVLESLGVSQYLKSPSCDRHSTPYTVNSKGWLNDCPSALMLDENISIHSSCYIPEKCTALYCCTDIPILNITVQTSIDLDLCNYQLTVTLEEVTLEYTLVDYNYGTWKFFSLYGLFGLSFMIEDLSSDDAVVFTVNVSSCLETSADCLFQQRLMEDVTIPKPNCNLNSGFKIANFSLTEFLDEKGLSSDGTQLSPYITSVLLHDIGVAPFLLEQQCDTSNLPYYPKKRGWNIACQKEVNTIPLDQSTVCHLYDYCTGVTCCTDVDIIGRSINTYVTLDPCNRRLSLGIEKYTVNISLFDYAFGKQEHIKLFGLVGLDLLIEDYPTERQYEVTLDLSICFESDSPCMISVPVLRKTILPKTICEWKSDFIDPNFSYQEFLEGKGLTKDHVLSVNDMKDLMDTLGITDFLQKQPCKTSEWINECNQSMAALPSNTGPIGCHISDTCSSVDCCITLEKIGWSFETFVNIEPCLFKLTVAIEQLQFSKWLFDYEWGYPVQVWLFGFIRMELSIVDLTAEEQYLIDLTLSVCMEADKSIPCELSVQIFNKYKLPKQKCNWNTGFFIENFSLQSWLLEEGFPDVSPLPAYTVSQLFSDLHVAAYLLDNSCQMDVAIYQDGWNSECNSDLTLPALPSNIACQVFETCTSIECCVEIPLLNSTLNFYLDVDTCRSSVTVGIERLYHKYSLLDYTFGETENFNLFGVTRLKYNLEDLRQQEMFILQLTFSFCLESNGPCELVIPILEDMIFPKPVCQSDTTFLTKGFSLEQWYRERKLLYGTTLPGHYVSELLEQTGLTSYLIDNTCHMNPHDVDSNGWKMDFDLSDWMTERSINSTTLSQLDLLRLYNDLDIGWYLSTACENSTTQIKQFDLECSALKEIPVLPSTAKCKLYESCNNISCCVEVPDLQRSFNMFLHLDTCDLKLTVGIEKLHYIQMIFNYQWGSNQSFWLNGIFRIHYQIHQLHYARKYRMSVALEVCMSSREPCIQNTTILDNVDLPQEECDWRQNYTMSGFAFSSWQSSKLSLQDTSDKELILQLKEETGIGFYLEQSACADDFEDTILQSNCSKFETITLLNGPIKCDITNQCNAIDCCVYDEKTLRSYKVFIHLSPCNDTVVVGIEKYKFMQSLLDFDWNQQHELFLGGIFRIQYQLKDLPGLNSFVVSMKVSICWSSETECDFSVTVLENAVLEKEVCEWKKPFLKQGFSLTRWEAESGYTVNITLHGQALTDLLEELGVSKYYEKNQCYRNDSIYFPQASEGWNIACPLSIQGIYSLPDSMACSLSDKCTSVDCCVDIKLLGRSFHIYLDIDPCYYRLTVGIERMKFNRSLLDYSWGSVLAVSLYGVMNLKFTVDDLPVDRMFIVSLNVSVCFEDNGSCNDSMVLRNVLLPKQVCKFTKDFVIEDFSLTKWMSDRDIIRTDVLKEYLLYQILEELDVSSFLNEYSCDRSKEPWGPSSNGWMNECPNYLTLPYLNGAETSCITLDTCTGIRCCVEAVSLGRSFVMSFEIDACNFMLTINIDKFVHNESLVNYVYVRFFYDIFIKGLYQQGLERVLTNYFIGVMPLGNRDTDHQGTSKQLYLKGIFLIEYTLDELPTTKEYVVSITLGICLESTEPNCMIKRVVADKTSLLKPSCDWNNGFSMQRKTI